MRFGPNPVLINIQRRDTDENFVRGAFASVGTIMGSLRQTTGQQRVEAGLLEDDIPIVIRVAITALTMTITIADRLIINSKDYEIRTVGLPERRGGYIEIGCVLSIGN